MKLHKVTKHTAFKLNSDGSAAMVYTNVEQGGHWTFIATCHPSVIEQVKLAGTWKPFYALVRTAAGFKY